MADVSVWIAQAFKSKPMFKVDVSGLRNHLNDIASRLDAQMPDVIAATCMLDLQAEWQERVFDRGENADGGKIGKYSTKGAYFDESKFIRENTFKPIGKTGKKTKRSMFLAKGYSQFRAIQSREDAFVNLKFGGSMEGAFRVYKFGKEVLFANGSAYENKKVQGNEDRFGDWASLTEGEKQMLRDSITAEAIIVAK